MKTAKHTILLFIIAVFGLIACKQKQTSQIRNDFKKYYDQFNVEGSFALYDPKADRYIFYHQDQFKKTFSPASTFKICNSLIGLETGVIKDESFVIPWDSVMRNPVWNKDHDLKTAFANSTVWYYQELARRVGGKRMKYWLDKANYGNADTSGGIDKFWLEGGLRVSPYQQIDFLQRLHENQLPFSNRSTEILKKIMVDKVTSSYVLRGKTGWGGQDHKEIGWFVGWLENTGQVYYFSNMVQMPDTSTNYVNFDAARKEIVYKILNDLKLTSNDE